MLARARRRAVASPKLPCNTRSRRGGSRDHQLELYEVGEGCTAPGAAGGRPGRRLTDSAHCERNRRIFRDRIRTTERTEGA